jgi:hypothetical protein
MSHEMNLFLFFKDRDYFTATVLPFVSNKMEKSFIDHWILGNYENLIKYSKIEYLLKLNTLEKCLLIFALLKTSHKVCAKSIASHIRLRSEQNEIKTQQKNRIFD